MREWPVEPCSSSSPRDWGMIRAIRARRRISILVAGPDRGTGGRRLYTVTGDSLDIQRVEVHLVVAPEGSRPILMTP